MKKMFLVLLAGLLAVSLISCGSSKGEKITLYTETGEGENVRLEVDFYYPENVGITLEEDEESKNWIDIHYEEKNVTISPAIFEDMTFDENKEYAKENEETYQEFKIRKYHCYGYEDFGGYWIYVHLEEVSDSTDRYLCIDTETIDFDKNYVEGIKQYEIPEVKKIIESFEYRGVVEIPEEENAKQE